ncbi:pyridoxamine 5'-phosphate oxidase family protein [Quadrisphaera sp. DSM 44207]|uniref:pyridoxamine 5'-phosphate oxidase family protein n=1 Tax=Quadrisphaera sp. DSM 44207 TaxID=1881057 RepID=UPI00088CF4D7|nr:pyridoxamine 5'-phosphate oxidase family protein [Quadrisphaera sp. DSM 44207]SDQ33641.1 Pyridoxamine 5'-phosphate oxidase [Quadrisphaera sp. DSM 44207]
MGAVHDGIDERLAAWLLEQPVFFVGTAPLDADGRVNVSPKGMAGTFAVLGASRVAYLDYTGSGVETIAHLRENGRIVVMFCAFSGPPTVVRLHGRGRVVLPDDADFPALRARFPKERTRGQRSVVVVDVERVADSCGYSVPLMDLRADRDVLDRAQGRRDDAYFARYWRTRNARSIDALPGLDPGTDPGTDPAPGA